MEIPVREGVSTDRKPNYSEGGSRPRNFVPYRKVSVLGRTECKMVYDSTTVVSVPNLTTKMFGSLWSPVVYDLLCSFLRGNLRRSHRTGDGYGARVYRSDVLTFSYVKTTNFGGSDTPEQYCRDPLIISFSELESRGTEGTDILPLTLKKC